MKSNGNTNKDEEVTSVKDMLKMAQGNKLTAKEFSQWAKSKGYSPKMVYNMTLEYMEHYQREGTSRK